MAVTIRAVEEKMIPEYEGPEDARYNRKSAIISAFSVVSGVARIAALRGKQSLFSCFIRKVSGFCSAGDSIVRPCFRDRVYRQFLTGLSRRSGILEEKSFDGMRNGCSRLYQANLFSGKIRSIFRRLSISLICFFIQNACYANR